VCVCLCVGGGQRGPDEPERARTLTQALVSDVQELADAVDSGEDGDLGVEVRCCLRRASVLLHCVHLEADGHGTHALAAWLCGAQDPDPAGPGLADQLPRAPFPPYCRPLSTFHPIARFLHLRSCAAAAYCRPISVACVFPPPSCLSRCVPAVPPPTVGRLCLFSTSRFARGRLPRFAVHFPCVRVFTCLQRLKGLCVC